MKKFHTVRYAVAVVLASTAGIAFAQGVAPGATQPGSPAAPAETYQGQLPVDRPPPGVPPASQTPMDTTPSVPAPTRGVPPPMGVAPDNQAPMGTPPLEPAPTGTTPPDQA